MAVQQVELNKRLAAAISRAERLNGRFEALAARAAEVERQVAQAKARLGLDEKVSSVLERLNERAHARAVGSFERLLSAILRDVFPEQDGVSLALGAERGLPTLSIGVRKADAVHDALHGAGGAVTNVVCAGLRFVSLLRAGNRRLLVLDEPDAWIGPQRVPRFFEVLTQVAQRTGIQTVIITHHDSAHFGPDVAVVALSRRDGRVVVDARGQLAFASEEQPGLRSIELVDFRAHEHTVIPLSPGVTAVVGDNDIGKSSALIGSLRAVAYGEAGDDVIRDGRPQAVVRLRLEGGTEVVWTRHAKGSPKVVYTLLRDGCKAAEGRPEKRGQVPPWVQDVLGVGPVEGLDIQLGSQKSPVFLIDQPGSHQARVLSVGRESARLSALMQAWADMKRADRETVRQGEVEFAQLSEKLQLRAQVQDATLHLELLETMAAQLAEDTQREAQLMQTMHELTRRSQHQRAAEAAAALQPSVAPTLQDTEALTRAIRRLQALLQRANLPRIDAVAWSEAGWTDTASLTRLVGRLQHYETRARLRPAAALPAAPTLQDTGVVTLDVQRLRQLSERLTAARAEAQRIDAQWRAAQRELSDFVQALGEHCPLCGAEVDEKGHAHAHATC